MAKWRKVIIPLLSILLFAMVVCIARHCDRIDLVVSVPDETYFSKGIEEYGFKAFQKKNPKINVQVKLQKDASNPFEEQADVYMLSPQHYDISSLLHNNMGIELDNWISNDSKSKLWCLDLFRNEQGGLIALPMFLGVYMINTSNSLADLTEYIEGGAYSWATMNMNLSHEPIVTDEALLIITRQVSQLSLWAEENPAAQLVLEEYLTSLKNLFKNCIYLEKWSQSQSLVAIEHGMLCDWFQSQSLSEELFLLLPQYGGEFPLTPIAARVGIVSKDCNHPELAVDFLESFTSLEAQMQLPTAGTVRMDLWNEINQQYSRHTEWAKENQQWWGNPISEVSFRQYERALTTGFIGTGSYNHTLEMVPRIKDYLSGSQSLQVTLEYFQSEMQRYCKTDKE